MHWKEQINLVFFIQVTIIASLGMSDPYWPLIVHHLDQTLTPKALQYWSGAIYLTPILITIVTIPLWSRLGDKIGHKKMLLRAGCALALTQFLIGFATNPVWLLGICLIQGFFAGFSAASQAWSVTMSQPEFHSYVIGRMRAATAIGSIVGPFIGGFIAHYVNYQSIFFLSGICCILVVITIAKYLQETAHKEIIRKTQNLMLLNRNSLYLLIMICFTQTAKWMSTPFFALYTTQRLSGNTLTVGILYSCIALMVFLSAPRWGIIFDKKINQSEWIKKFFVTTLWVSSGTQFLFAVNSNIFIAILISLLWGICIGAISLLPFSLLIKQAHDQLRGSMVGLGNSAAKLGNLMGIALGTFIQAETNFAYSFLSIGFLYTLLGLLILFSMRSQSEKESKIAVCLSKQPID